MRLKDCRSWGTGESELEREEVMDRLETQVIARGRGCR